MKSSSLLLLLTIAALVATSSIADDQNDVNLAIGRKWCKDVNKCFCTKSIPPQCHCRATARTCYPSCRNCVCMASKDQVCECKDVRPYCA